MRAKALDDGQLSDRDKDFERAVLQAHVRIAGAIEAAQPAQDPKEAAMDEIKRMIGEHTSWWPSIDLVVIFVSLIVIVVGVWVAFD
jgi:hypothetical protein